MPEHDPRRIGRRGLLKTSAALLGGAVLGARAKAAPEPPFQNVNNNSSPSTLKITDLRIATVRKPGPSPCTIVRLDTNQGVYGLGEVRDGASAIHVYELMIAVSEMQRREMKFLYTRVRRANWDGAVALDRLFQGEHVPDDPGVYLDQRFIDYLAKNGEDMGRIHWRNFERLTTEFFRRQGYEVDLGRGTKDGGVDVRVWTDRESKAGPPILLIQCKRYNVVV